jgi:hypothetical protein
MKRILSLLLFVILLLVGTIGACPDAQCAQTVIWTIKNGTITGDNYTFEVWARATDESILVQGANEPNNYHPNQVCIMWNPGALQIVNSAGRVDFSSRWRPPFYSCSWVTNALAPEKVNVSFWQSAGNTPLYLSQDGPDGEIILTVTLRILDRALDPGLAWGTLVSSFPNIGIIGALNTFNIGNNNPLPIQLASFKVVMLRSSGVSLSWTTVSELNNYGFEVQCSPDGKDFASIAGSFVPGNGTTNHSHAYSYVDANPAGATSYRLKQIDLDGTVDYSEAVQLTAATNVKEQKAALFTLGQNYPNPFNPSTTISYEVAEYSLVNLAVYDILGCKVAELVNERKAPGSYEVKFYGRGGSDSGGNGSNLVSGIYFYRLRAGDQIETKRLLLLR